MMELFLVTAGCFLAVVGFAVLVETPGKYLLQAGFAGACGGWVYFFGMQKGLDTVPACFLSALVISLLAHIFARIFKAPVTVFLIAGMGLFQLGAEMAMTPLGQGVGGKLMKGRKLMPILLVSFLMGVIITIAEPDLQVLANQVASIPNPVLIWTVAVGVGVFLVVAVLRVLLHISLANMLLIFYVLLFGLSFFSPDSFTAVAFDSGGVTTGPMTVPFIMALGVGLSAARSDRDGASDSFGLVALCSVGPILMVLLLGIFYSPSGAVYTTIEVAGVATTRDVVDQFLYALPQYGKEVTVSILPVAGVFVLFQLFTRTYHRRQVLRMAVGFVYTIAGLILFLTGVNVGFAPVGGLFGSGLADSRYKWLLIPIGVLIGYYLVKAEPAVQILNEQVEDLTGGTISRKMMNSALSLGVACAVALAMVRVLTGINIYWVIIPGYIIALVLSRFVPKVFVGIAFDSGGVASGPMTSTFLLPLAMGASTAIGGNVVTDAFGVVALVALAPLIAIQIMGLVYEKKTQNAPAAQPVPEEDFVEFEEESE